MGKKYWRITAEAAAEIVKDAFSLSSGLSGDGPSIDKRVELAAAGVDCLIKQMGKIPRRAPPPASEQ